MKSLRLARMMEERGPCRNCTDRNAQSEVREEDQTVPLRIQNRGKRPVNQSRASATGIRQDFGIRDGMR